MPKSLGEMVREKLDANVLPCDPPVKLWAGFGSYKLYTVCEHPIRPAQVDYEPQYDDGCPVVRFHAGCHGLWEAELRRRGHRRSE